MRRAPRRAGPPKALAADWAAFAAVVGARLRAGARVYGDASLAAPPRALADEVEQELADLAGWGFILWRRVRQLRARLPDAGGEP